MNKYVFSMVLNKNYTAIFLFSTELPKLLNFPFICHTFYRLIRMTINLIRISEGLL
jgi:hypothetical protein